MLHSQASLHHLHPWVSIGHLKTKRLRACSVAASCSWLCLEKSVVKVLADRKG